MDNKMTFGQPLMMRKDYGKTEDKDALMIKSVPIKDYDRIEDCGKMGQKNINEDGSYIDDYDSHGCGNGCFLCDR